MNINHAMITSYIHYGNLGYTLCLETDLHHDPSLLTHAESTVFTTTFFRNSAPPACPELRNLAQTLSTSAGTPLWNIPEGELQRTSSKEAGVPSH